MPNRPKMGEILLRAGAIDKFQLEAALGEQARWGRRLGATLVKMGFIDEHDLVRAVAIQLNLSVARLDGKTIAPEVIAQVPPSVARRHTMLPLFIKQAGIRRTLFVGVEDPADLEAFDDLAFRTGMDVKPVMMVPTELHQALDQYYDAGEDDEAWALRTESHRTDGSTPQDTDDAEAAAPAPERADVAPGTEALAEFWDVRREVESPESGAEEVTDDSPRIIPVEVAVPAKDAVRSADEEQELSLDDLHTEEKLESNGVKTRIIIHALCNLLIEKGVMTREELEGWVRELQLRETSDDTGTPGAV